MSKRLIYAEDAIDAVDSETVSTCPDYFKSGEKFIEFMDDADIASFGKWQWANGFNTALTVTKIQLKKLPSAQPERKRGEWIVTSEFEDCRYVKCNQCKVTQVFYHNKPLTNYCPNCGSNMRGVQNE